MYDEEKLERYIIENLPTAKVKQSGSDFYIYANNLHVRLCKGSYSLSVISMKIKTLTKSVTIQKTDFSERKLQEIENMLIQRIEKYISSTKAAQHAKRQNFIMKAIGEE